MSRPVPLWHFTCAHGAAGIREDKAVKPGWGLGAYEEQSRVSWFTDLPRPDRQGLGLTSTLLRCDRTAFRFRVTDPSLVVPWSQVRDRLAYADGLESAPGALPEHWWVAAVPVPVREA